MPKMRDGAQIKPVSYDAKAKRLTVLLPDGSQETLKSVGIPEYETWVRSKAPDLYFRMELFAKKQRVEKPKPAPKPEPAAVAVADKPKADEIETGKIRNRR